MSNQKSNKDWKKHGRNMPFRSNIAKTVSREDKDLAKPRKEKVAIKGKEKKDDLEGSGKEEVAIKNKKEDLGKRSKGAIKGRKEEADLVKRSKEKAAIKDKKNKKGLAGPSKEEVATNDMEKLSITSLDGGNFAEVIDRYDSWQLLLAKNDRQNTLQHSHTELRQLVTYPVRDPRTAKPRTQLEKQRLEARQLKFKLGQVGKESPPDSDTLANQIPGMTTLTAKQHQNFVPAPSLLALSDISGMSDQMEVESLAKRRLFEHLSSTMMLDPLPSLREKKPSGMKTHLLVDKGTAEPG